MDVLLIFYKFIFIKSQSAILLYSDSESQSSPAKAFESMFASLPFYTRILYWFFSMYNVSKVLCRTTALWNFYGIYGKFLGAEKVWWELFTDDGYEF